MLALSEKQALIQALGQVVVDELKTALAPLQDRVTQLEKAIGDLAVVKEQPLGEARPDENPPPIDADFLREYVQGALHAFKDAMPPVRDGHDGKDGRDGADGVDGTSVGLDELRACVVDVVAETVAGLAVPRHCVAGVVDRAGHLQLSFSDGSLMDLGQVVGRDGMDGKDGKDAKGEPGKDGIDGLGIAQIEYDGERTFRLANEKTDLSFTIPFPLYQGIWKQGAYVRGDQVTSDNQIWMAMRDTDKEPGTIDSGWRLACKRGPAGKPGKDAK